MTVVGNGAKGVLALPRIITLILLLAVAGNTLAGGPYPTLSGIAAAADDAMVAATNPAAMTRFDRQVRRGEVMVFYSDNTWEGQIGEEGPAFRSQESDTTIIPSGNMVRPVRDNLWFGFTILGSGFSDDYEDGWLGRYFIEEYELVYLSAFPSLATKLTDKLSVAASLALTYTTYEQIKAVPNDPGLEDGTLTVDTDGWSAGWALSGLYEFSDTTRVGLSYRSKIEPDLSGQAKFSGLGPMTEAILDAAGLLNAGIDVSSAQPQSVLAGVYHQFDDGGAITVDAVWSDFSNFSLAEIYVNGDQIVESDVDYDDILALSASYSRPVAERWRVGIGGFITNDMVNDDNRTLTLRLDRIWSLGAGFDWQWRADRKLSVTLNYLKIDDAPVTTPPLPGIGPVTGRFTDRGTIYLRAAVAFGPPVTTIDGP
jgi:long-chain fatty acid transport protein